MSNRAIEIVRQIRAKNRVVGEHATYGGIQRKKSWSLTEDEAAELLIVGYDRDIKALEGYEHTVDDAVALKTACLKYGIAVQESDEISPVNYRHMTRRLVDAVKRGFYEMPDQADQVATIDRLRSQPSYSGVLRAADSLSGTITLQVSAEMFAAASVVTDGAYVVSRYQEDA